MGAATLCGLLSTCSGETGGGGLLDTHWQAEQKTVRPTSLGTTDLSACPSKWAKVCGGPGCLFAPPPHHPSLVCAETQGMGSSGAPGDADVRTWRRHHGDPSLCPVYGLRIKGEGPAPQVTWVGVWQDAGGTPADKATTARSREATKGRAPQGPPWQGVGVRSFRMAVGYGGHRWTDSRPPNMAETKRDISIWDSSP